VLRARALIGAAVAATALGAAAVPALGGTQPKAATTQVTVADDYYACSKCSGTYPLKLTVNAGDKVKWLWADDNVNTHNVKLTDTHPKGVKPKDFTSGDYAVGATFAKKFSEPGKYSFICTYHKNVMRIDLKVAK
jgi:plastocyanin